MDSYVWVVDHTFSRCSFFLKEKQKLCFYYRDNLRTNNQDGFRRGRNGSIHASRGSYLSPLHRHRWIHLLREHMVRFVFPVLFDNSASQGNRHNLPLDRHAANKYGGWVKIVKRFRLSHKPLGLASLERVTV